MNSEYYTLTSVYIFMMDMITAITVLQALRLFGAPRPVSAGVATTFAVWLAILVFGIEGQRLFPQDISATGFFVILLAGVGIVAAATFLAPVKDALLNVPQEFLLFPQGLRAFLGAGFLVQASLGIMPAMFGILDGITHTTAGFLALSAAILYKSQWKSARSVLIANIFGLLDIVVVAGGISFVLLKDISPHHNVMYAAFFAAPIFITLHLASLWKLQKGQADRRFAVNCVS